MQGSQTGSNHHVWGRNVIRNSTLPPPLDISSKQASQGLGSSDLPPWSQGLRALTLEHTLGSQ